MGAASPEAAKPDTATRVSQAFVRLWIASGVSELGSQVTLVALPLSAILVLHSSAFAVAVLSSFDLAPFLLFGVVAGMWVDRLPYRRVLVAADLGRAALLGSVPCAYALGVLTLAQLYAVGFLAGTLTVFFSCAYGAYVPSLVDRARLVDANAKLEVTRSAAQTAGPGLGGGLVAIVAAPVALFADAASFLASALVIGTIRGREVARPAPTERRLGAELREGFSFVWGHPIFRPNLFASGLANFGYGIVWAILLVYAVRVLGLHAGVIGAVLAVGQGVGVMGAFLARRVAARIGIGPTFVASVACCGLGTLLLAAAGHRTAVPLLALGWGLWGFGTATSAVLGATIRQLPVPPRLYGRVLGANRTIIWAIAPVGALVGGALATSIGLRPTLLVAAAVAMAAPFPLAFSPVRRLRVLAVP